MVLKEKSFNKDSLPRINITVVCGLNPVILAET
jgi:hypothetical protein